MEYESIIERCRPTYVHGRDQVNVQVFKCLYVANIYALFYPKSAGLTSK